MILPWIRRRGSGLARRAAARFRRSVAEARTAGLALRAHRYDSEVPRMNRQNLFSDAWDGENEEAGTRHRIFWRPDDARMGATLYELAPDAPETRMHMHFGAEEMFFVLSGRRLPNARRGLVRDLLPQGRPTHVATEPVRSSRSVGFYVARARISCDSRMSYSGGGIIARFDPDHKLGRIDRQSRRGRASCHGCGSRAQSQLHGTFVDTAG